MFWRICAAAVALVIAFAAQANNPQSRCERILAALGNRLVGATCTESPDLTTNNEATTPPDNSLPGQPTFAFTPRGDRAVLVDTLSTPPVKTPIAGPVPGVQITARIASDPLGKARFLLRLPDNWNGRLVVAGASAQRSEYNGDYAWSDYVVQKGYAYASQNKGTLNFYLTTSADPLGCRLNPASTTYVHFYDDDPGQQFTRWTQFMIEAARLARTGVRGAYGQPPRYTYAVGTSNGGYQVRRAVETAPDLFDGGVDSEGTYVDKDAPNLLSDLPPGVLNLPDYVASGFNADSTAAKNLRGAGYPPDLINLAVTPSSMWQQYYVSYWELTMCQWQKRLDPTYNTYGSGLATYNYSQRLAFSDVGQQMDDITTTGNIKRPLVTVAGTLDALLPIDHHARAYERAVDSAFAAAKKDDDDHHRWGNDHRNRPAYRLYEVQNGNHIENYKFFHPELEYLLPHTHRAFDLLVGHVEQGIELPPNQCIPRGGAIADSPSQPGHCQEYLVSP
jgi:predicted esterase